MSRHTGQYAYASGLPTGKAGRADSDHCLKDANSRYPTTSAYPDPPAQVGHPSYVPSHSGQRREPTCMSAPARHQPQDSHQYQPTSAMAIPPLSYRPMGTNDNPQRHKQVDHPSAMGRDRRASDASLYGSPLSRTSSSNFSSASLSSSYGNSWSMQQQSGATRRPSLVSRPSDDDDDDCMYGWQRDPGQKLNRHQVPGTTPSVIEEDDDDDDMYGWRTRRQNDQNWQASNPTNRHR